MGDKHPKMHHNSLIKIIVPKYMAKTTFEKTRNNLIEKNILNSIMDGNRKFYLITKKYGEKTLQLTERISHEDYQRLQHEIKKMEESFHHKDISEKKNLSVTIITKLLQTDNSFTILDSIKNPKKLCIKMNTFQFKK